MRSAVTAEEATRPVLGGATVVVGGFLAVGTPERPIEALVARRARGPTVDGRRHRAARADAPAAT